MLIHGAKEKTYALLQWNILYPKRFLIWTLCGEEQRDVLGYIAEHEIQNNPLKKGRVFFLYPLADSPLLLKYTLVANKWKVATLQQGTAGCYVIILPHVRCVRTRFPVTNLQQAKACCYVIILARVRCVRTSFPVTLSTKLPVILNT